MKFCDKLQKQRKEKNMSQEQLADRCGVSRQAVSKWESGRSYPDMDKIMLLCEILDCNIYDLIDDVASGNTTSSKTKKMNIGNYLQEFLSFITKTVNMFWSMRLREKIKCILEIIIMIILITSILGIFYTFIYNEVIRSLSGLLPYPLQNIINAFFTCAYLIFSIIIGFIVVIHIFKIRYLDYFVTVEDEYANDKIIEEPINDDTNNNAKKEQRVFLEKKKNKIIIRDAKHSIYNFFYLLAKIAIVFFKGCLIMVALPLIMFLIFLIFCSMSALIFMKDGLFFAGLFVAGSGTVVLGICLLKIIYNFIFNQKMDIKNIFIILITSFSLIGVGGAISFCTYLNFYDNKDNLVTDHYNIKMNDNIILPAIDLPHTEIIVDDSLEDMVIDVKYHSGNKVSIEKDFDYDSNDKKYYYYFYDNMLSPIDSFKMALDSLKHKRRIYKIFDYKVVVHISSSNLEKIKLNNDLINE